MKKIFNFGKINFEGKGKVNLVTIEMEYKEKNEKKCFSVRGNVWNARHSDIICGGQCLDTIAEYVQDPVFIEIFRLWNLYHLNDMHPDCEHQRADIAFQQQKQQQIIVYKWLHLHDEIAKEKRSVTEFIKTELTTHGTVTLNNRQHFLYNLEDCIYNHVGEYDKTLYSHKDNEIEYKTLNWISVNEHEKGLLSKPCPVCGYKYGSSWIYAPIPADDEKIICDLLNNKEI